MWIGIGKDVSPLIVLQSYYNLRKDGARHPRTLKMFVRYLLRGVMRDLNETWHSKGPRAGEEPHEV